jgi:hypothetical protein
MPTGAEIAWAAGLFEGEGNVGLRYHAAGHVYGAALRLEMTDRDVLDRFAGIIPGGKVYGPYRRGARRKPMFSFQLGAREPFVAACRVLLPWLGHRRRGQVETVLAQLPPLPTRVFGPDCDWQGSGSWSEERHRQRGEIPCRRCRDKRAAEYAARRAS